MSLGFSKLIAIDGNNSLQHIDPTVVKNAIVTLDTRDRYSDIWITPEHVNKFQNEVHKKVDDIDVEGDVTERSLEITACVERWCAAAPDVLKWIWKMLGQLRAHT